MSDSSPHGLQHARLPCPSLSPGGGLIAKSCPTLVTPWTVAHQDPLSMEFPRHKFCSGLSFLSPGDLPNPGIKIGSPTLYIVSWLQVDSLPTEPPLEFAEIHAHWVSDVIQLSHLLSPPLPSFSFSLYQHRGLFQTVSCSHQVVKILEIQLQH